MVELGLNLYSPMLEPKPVVSRRGKYFSPSLPYLPLRSCLLNQMFTRHVLSLLPLLHWVLRECGRRQNAIIPAGHRLPPCFTNLKGGIRNSSPDLGNWLPLQSFVFEGPGNAFQFSLDQSLLSGLPLLWRDSLWEVTHSQLQLIEH